jgi:hypothetical protein
LSARRTDPWTSHAAAESMVTPARTQREALLAAYAANPLGLTDEEACTIAGIPGGWKRCSELRKLGRIIATPYTRLGSSGRHGIVCAIPAPTTLFGGTQ